MNILIINTVGFRFSDENISNLRKDFPEHEFTVVDDKDVTDDEVRRAEVMVGFPDPKLLSKAENLKWLHLSSIGVDKHVDKSLYANPDVILTNSSGIYGKPISDHIVGYMIALTRNFPFFIRNQEKAAWIKKDADKDIFGSTALIVGLGDVGRNLARKLKAFDVHTIAVKRTMTEKPDYIDELYTTESLDELIPRADFVILCVAATPETAGIMNRDRIALMRKDSYLINIGRGSLIDQDALYEALSEKRIAGAAADSSTPEPLPPESRFWQLDNMIITPHCSGKSPTTYIRQYAVFYSELERFSKGEKLKNLIDFDLKY